MTEDAETIYRRERDDLLRFAVLLVGDRDVAEDAVADAVARAWQRLGSDIAEPGRYLRRAVANLLIDGKRRGAVADRQRQLSTVGDVPAVDAGVVDQAVLTDALETLPTGQRAVVVCRYYQALSVAETADVLNISEGTVKSRMARALTALRTVLEPNEQGDANVATN